jgi:hypothetical protein
MQTESMSLTDMQYTRQTLGRGEGCLLFPCILSPFFRRQLSLSFCKFGATAADLWTYWRPPKQRPQHSICLCAYSLTLVMRLHRETENGKTFCNAHVSIGQGMPVCCDRDLTLTSPRSGFDHANRLSRISGTREGIQLVRITASNSGVCLGLWNAWRLSLATSSSFARLQMSHVCLQL